MIHHPAFAIDPWTVRETTLDLTVLAQTESVFALTNGHLGLRGNLDEGEPHGLPGTYLNGFYERGALRYAETGYGYPEAGQVIVDVTNGKVVRLLVDDEPFDVRHGLLHRHERVLDLRAGLLRRRAEWTSPAGRTVRVTSIRLVSLVHRSVAAISYEVEVLDASAHLVVQSELVANEPLPDVVQGDPRAAVGVSGVLRPEHHSDRDAGAVLVHTTIRSGLRLGAGMDHDIDASTSVETRTESGDDLARFTALTRLEPGQRFRLHKYLAYGWSSQRSIPAMRDQIEAALATTSETGWKELCTAQRNYLDEFWDRADVEIEGDPELQQAIRFSLFHTLQAGARGEQQAIAAKGLTGPGYDGHTFWDMDAYVLPVLTYTAPEAARDALGWRHRTLDLARARARTLAVGGAAFPWRTIDGRECSGYWPAGTAAVHVGAEIADAVVRYVGVARDVEFERQVGVEILVETARFYRSLGHHDRRGGFRIDGVTGPDEYSALADNNVYTNLMAQRDLRAAAAAIERHPDLAGPIGVTSEETASWRDAADAMIVPFDDALHVHPQSEGFTNHEVWEFQATRGDQYPLMLHFHYFDLYRKQVVKQADLVFALYRRGDAFTPEEKLRDFEYYESLTVRDSSLSASVQAIVAAEVGHLPLAYDYLREAALIDLDDTNHNTRDGLHIACLAGAWLAVAAGLGGLRDHDGQLSFAPRLPERITRLAFRLTFRGRRIEISFDRRYTYLELRDGPPLEVGYYDDVVTIPAGPPLALPLRATPVRLAPTQPPGRAPAPPPS